MASTHEQPALYVEETTGVKEWYTDLRVGQDPDLIVYYNDFVSSQDYAATDWTITTTEAGSGSATEALAADELNGALLITNDDADNDLDSLQQNEETWKLQSGKKLWFETRIKINDVDKVDNFIGLNITDTTPLATSDRVGFQLVTDGGGSIQTLCEKDSVETNEDSEKDMADATYVKLGFRWDGSSKVKFFVDRVEVTEISTNVPDDENLAITIHHQNGEAAAQTITIDYIYVAMER